MKLDLLPPTGVAGIDIGSSREVARDRSARLGEPEEFRRGGEETPSLVVQRPSGLALFVYFDSDDHVEAIEVARPDSDDDAVRYLGHDLFATPAEELIERLEDGNAVEVDEDGRAVTCPTSSSHSGDPRSPRLPRMPKDVTSSRSWLPGPATTTEQRGPRGQRPFHTGFRFSANALKPSSPSSEE